MKVLVSTPFPIWPPTHGGRVRVERLAVSLADAGARVDVMFPWRPPMRFGSFEQLGVFWHPQYFAANVLPLALGERRIPPLVALSWQPTRLGPRRRLHQFAGYDVIQFEFCAQARHMNAVPAGAKVVYSSHNVEYDFLRQQPPPLLRSAMLRRIEWLERASVRRSDLVVACTREDASRLEDLYGSGRFAVVPNGFDSDLLHLNRVQARAAARAAFQLPDDELVLLFVGGPAAHNREAVAFLVDRVLPELDARTTLLVVGGSGDRESAERGRDGGRMRRLGYMADLRPAFAAADIGVNPVRTGSGSNLKIAEYLAAGLPVVTTPVGMRGFESFRRWIEVAPLEQFAARLRTVRPNIAERPAGLEDLSWAALGRSLYEIYDDLLGA
jgi:glycosyltransferase involved in cell wall biosynthesis